MRQTAAIRRRDLEAGQVPRICIRTGQPASVDKEVDVRLTPDWTSTLLIGGVLAWTIGRMGASEWITLTLPVSHHGVRLSSISAHQDGEWLWLSGVHRDFARALGRMYARLPETERPRLGR